jgi:hypothetical protein
LCKDCPRYDFLREAYKRIVNNIGGLCAPIGDEASSVDDFLCWFESEVVALPEIFAGANENFMSIALEGVLHMAKQQDSVDLDALQMVASVCRTTVFLAPREVKKTLRRITKDWWRPFGYKDAIFVVRTKLREVVLLNFRCFDSGFLLIVIAIPD